MKSTFSISTQFWFLVFLLNSYFFLSERLGSLSRRKALAGGAGVVPGKVEPLVRKERVMRLEDMGLRGQTVAALKQCGFETVGDVVDAGISTKWTTPEVRLFRNRGLGPATLRDFRIRFHEMWGVPFYVSNVKREFPGKQTLP